MWRWRRVSSGGVGGCFLLRALIMSVVGRTKSSLDVRVLSAALMSPSAHLEWTRRAMSPSGGDFRWADRFTGIAWEPSSMSTTCLLIAVAVVGRRSPVFSGGARSATKAKERNRSHVSALGSARAVLISFDRQSAVQARAAFGILLMTEQLLRSSDKRLARLLGCVLAAL